MCEQCGVPDEDEGGDEQVVIVEKVAPPNVADYLLALWQIPAGLLQGFAAFAQRIHFLTYLKSQAIDQDRERKEAAKEFERTLRGM